MASGTHGNPALQGASNYPENYPALQALPHAFGFCWLWHGLSVPLSLSALRSSPSVMFPPTNGADDAAPSQHSPAKKGLELETRLDNQRRETAAVARLIRRVENALEVRYRRRTSRVLRHPPTQLRFMLQFLLPPQCGSTDTRT